MGFFDKLFGGSKKPTEEITKPKIRAQFKDEKYFKNENNRVDASLKSLNQIFDKGSATPYNYWAKAMDEIDILTIKYSMGEDVSNFIDYYDTALKYYIKGWDEEEATYADMLNIISLGILLETSDGNINELINYVVKTDNNNKLKNWHPDGLLWFLLSSRNLKTKKEISEMMFPKIYKKLYEITSLPKEEAEKAIKEYLGKWYDMHKEDTWYNAHLREKGYKGYWAWEVAAVVKVLGLDDSSFNKNPYYPYDMVHWKDKMKKELAGDSGDVLKDEFYSVCNAKGDKVPVYEFPSTMVPPVIYLDNNIEVLVTAYNNPEGWCQIISKDKKKGYVHSNYVKKNQ